VNDIVAIFGGKLPAALGLRTDRGPDWGLQNFVNVVYLGRLFLDFKLDILSLFHFKADNSAFGIIERLWAPVADWLAGKAYSPKFDGDECPPCQLKIPKEQVKEKEVILFDKLLAELKSDLSGRSISSFVVSIESIPCVPSTTRSEMREVYNDHEEWSAWLNSKKKLYDKKGEVKDPSDLPKLTVIIAILNHLVRLEDQLLFVRCSTEKMCGHCSALPKIRADNMHSLLVHDGKMKPLIVQKDPLHRNHYTTFVQEYLSRISNPALVDPLPSKSISGEALSYCDEHDFLFTSAAEREKHFELAHKGLPTKSFQIGRFVCRFKVADVPCNQGFDTMNLLAKHKKETSHVRPMTKRRKSNGDNVKGLFKKGDRICAKHSEKGKVLWYCGTVDGIVRHPAYTAYEITFDDGEEASMRNSDFIGADDFFKCLHAYSSPSPKKYNDHGVELLDDIVIEKSNNSKTSKKVASKKAASKKAATTETASKRRTSSPQQENSKKSKS
jgi:hypothetical protein